MSSCSTIRTDSRIRSTPSPARNASSNSDTADWDNAIGGLLFSVCLAVHTEDPADGPQASAGHAVDHPKPHHTRGLTRRHSLLLLRLRSRVWLGSARRRGSWSGSWDEPASIREAIEAADAG